MNCREFRSVPQGAPVGEEGTTHLATCARCRVRWESERLRHWVLEASRLAEPIADPGAKFYQTLARRLRQTAPGEARNLWLPTLGLARSFMTAAMIILVIITALNLYLIRPASNTLVRMDSYWRDANGDGEAIVLSDEAITHDQVLKSLVALRERHGK